ncbi:MAG: hypothetical protein JXB32_17960 [Deltaproteobacteria bacterium]|nr:hypothetical protein [Deltaproteobacteria bacterium]
MGRRRRTPADAPPPEVEPEESTAGEVNQEPTDTDDDPGLLEDGEIPEADLEGGVELPSPADPRVSAPPLNLGLGSTGPIASPLPLPMFPDPYGTPQQQQGGYQEQRSPYDQPDDDPMPVRPPAQPRRDGDPSREVKAAFGMMESDVLVSAKIEYEDAERGYELVSCGRLNRITLSRARMPETYIPSFEGTFWITPYHADTGRPLGNAFAHHSTGTPFLRGWRVDMNVQDEINKGVAAALARLGIHVPENGSPAQLSYGAPGPGVPTGVFNGQVGWYQQQQTEMLRRLEAAEERARKAEEDRRIEQTVAPLRDALNRLEQRLANGGGENAVLAKVIDGQTRLAEAAMQRGENGKSGFGEALELFRMTNGPEAMGAMAAVNKMVVDNLVTMVKTAKGGDEKFKVGELMEAYEKFNKSQIDNKKMERDWMDKKAQEKRDYEERRAREDADRKAKKDVALASISRSTDAMLMEIRDAMSARRPPNEVGMMVNVMYTSLIAFGWADKDKKGAGDMGANLKSDPEKVFTQFAYAAGIGRDGTVSNEDARYIGMCAAFFRQFAGLGQRQVSQEPKADARPPSGAPAEAPANNEGAPTAETGPKDSATPRDDAPKMPADGPAEKTETADPPPPTDAQQTTPPPAAGASDAQP